MPVAVPAAIAVTGAASSMYGAKKTADATKEAAEKNAQAVAETNAMNYKRWLESKGIGEGGQAINAKLPRYMMWNPSAVANRQPNTYGPFLTYNASAASVPAATGTMVRPANPIMSYSPSTL